MSDLEYNIDNDNANQKWEKDDLTGDVVERVDLTQAETITVAGCKHEKTTRTPALEFDNYDEVKCLECPLGFFVKREV